MQQARFGDRFDASLTTMNRTFGARGTFEVPQYTLGSDGKPFEMLGSMPDLWAARPTAGFTSGPYLLLLFEDPPTIVQTRTGRRGAISYLFSLAVFDIQKKRIVRLIGLEEGFSGTRMIGIFDCAGVHLNMGDAERMSLDMFLEAATELFRQETGCAAPVVPI